MSFIPDFKVGLLNAWIFTIFIIFVYAVPGNLINKKAMRRFYCFTMYFETSSKRTGTAARFLQIIYPIVGIYSIFLPIKIGTTWFYAGLIIFIIAFIWSIITHICFANSKLNDPVTGGTYRYSRNPTYFGQFLLFVGISIACISWIVLLLVIIYILTANYLINLEEDYCLEKYGDAYKKYMKRTPKWIGIQKSEKKQ